jgi:hypothetical protein
MHLHPAFRSRPDLGQFARHGAWEEAWSFPPSRPPSGPELAAWLSGAEEAAFEAFFGEAFFGLRFTGSAEAVAASARRCVGALAQARDGRSFFAALSAAGLCPVDPGPVRSAEAGAVNAWRSTGPFPVPLGVDFGTLWPELQASPLVRETRHRKALELVTPGGWFGLPISGPEPPFPLDPALLREALAFAAAQA